MTKLKLVHCLMAITLCSLTNVLQAAPKPKLVVGLVIDQMRWDYLYRYSERYGKGGFKRLLREGFSFENTHLNYIPAFTACGHASIYTGSVPAIHGITGNEWLVQNTGEKQYCTGDSTVKTVGSTSPSGKMSPKNLLTTTIGDELKLATNFKAKVVGIAIKDRGAVLPAGHAADVAYWFDELTGNWITSTYYKSELPKWVQEFNQQELPVQLLAHGWNTLYHIESYTQSTADQNGYEGAYPSEIGVVFPHRFNAERLTSFGMFKSTPFANTFTFDFAKKAIASESLGKDEITDLLAISLSATDYIGHQFGPNSVEVEDTYLRLDRDLESFFNYLDKMIGKGNYTFFLTADHGAAHNPSFLKDKKLPAGYWDARALENKLNVFLAKKYGIPNLVKMFLNYQLQLNPVDLNTINLSQLKNDCISFINNQEGVAYAVDLEHIGTSALPALLKDKITNGYHRKRSGIIQIVLEAGWFQVSSDLTGTIHGAWNAYDSHIPLIFMGTGIKKGRSSKNVAICDIAPTLASLLQIQEPSGNVGKVISFSK